MYCSEVEDEPIETGEEELVEDENIEEQPIEEESDEPSEENREMDCFEMLPPGLSLEQCKTWITKTRYPELKLWVDSTYKARTFLKLYMKCRDTRTKLGPNCKVRGILDYPFDKTVPPVFSAFSIHHHEEPSGHRALFTAEAKELVSSSMKYTPKDLKAKLKNQGYGEFTTRQVTQLKVSELSSS